MRNKIKRIKFKVDPDGAVLHPTYEELVSKTNEIMDFTDKRTIERDIQVKKLNKKIKTLSGSVIGLKTKIKLYQSFLKKEKHVIDEVNKYLDSLQMLFNIHKKDIKKIKQRLKI